MRRVWGWYGEEGKKERNVFLVVFFVFFSEISLKIIYVRKNKVFIFV